MRQSLILLKGNQGYDISQLVKSIKWKGRKGSAARSITVSLVDNEILKSGIDVEKGHKCIFKWDNKELFRGIAMSQTQTSKNNLTFTAYDNGIYLANNKDTFTYKGKTADYVFKDCCKRFNIPYGNVAKCSYIIPELTKSKTTGFDTICDALSLDFDATGIRHYVISEKGVLKLLTRRENILQWVIETGQNLISYDYSKSIEKIKTRIKMVSKEDTVIAVRKKESIEKQIGIFQDIEKPDESLSKAQITDLINSILEEKSTPERTLNIESIGIPSVISGVGVYVIIKELGLSRTFYVDEDTHTFDDNKHTMSLKLSFANDLSKAQQGESSTDSNKRNVGDIVQFKGGSHYVSSMSTTPTGGNRKAGPAKITLIAKGAKHPYHLIHTDSKSNVYGWVDSNTFS